MLKRLFFNDFTVPSIAVLFAICSECSGLDLWLGRHFYDSELLIWPYKTLWLTQDLLHKGGRTLVIVMVVVLLLLLVGSCFRSELRPYRKDLSFILLAGVSGPAIVGGLKALTHIYSPWDLQIFGGQQLYIRLFDSVPIHAPVGHAFPAGHASGGFAWFSLFFALRQRAVPWYQISLLLPLLLGCFFGIAQQARGAHFLSHDLVTLAICWLSAVAWMRFFLCWHIPSGHYQRSFVRHNHVRLQGINMKASRFNLLAVIAAVAMTIFFLTRLALISYSSLQIDMSMASVLQILGRGLLFDAGFCAYALILPALYLWLVPERLWRLRLHRYWLQILTFAAFYALTFVAIAEYFFWDEFSVRFNFVAIDYLIYRREVTDNIFESYPVIALLAVVLVVAALIYYSLRRYITRALYAEERFSRLSVVAALVILLPLVAYAGLDQEQRKVSDNAYQNELASNGPYQFVAAFRNNELDYLKFYARLAPEKASALLKQEVAEPNATFLSNDLFDIRRDIKQTGPEKKLNVILVMVESLSSDYLTYFGNKEQWTPNLDALIKKSLFFPNFYATGTRTTRGLEAVTLSIPPTPGRSIVKRIGRETDQWSLGNVLNTKGYQSSFLYGGRSYFDNMGAFFSGNGYQVVDQTSVPDNEIGFSNAWGMSDGDLYQQAIKVADKSHAEGQPFFLHLMTTSNHRPYTYPEGQIDIPSGTGRSGAVKYTDHAIGDFLADAARQPWFDDTLFVIVADHQSGSSGKRALPIERYHIPLWIYAPQHIVPEQVERLSSQIDLAPTLLSLLNMSYRSCFFGKDILAMTPGQERALIGNYQNLGLFDGNSLAILGMKQKMQRQDGFTSGSITEHPAQKSEILLQRDISYYQGAAYIYGHRLNAWQPPATGVAAADQNTKAAL